MKKLRINKAIRASEVRLISDDNEQLGILNIEEAEQIAVEKSLDLVEVAPLSKPPVCRLMDYGNYRYQQKKAEKKQRKSQKQTEIKGVRLSIRTGQHDLEIKARQAQKFLENRHNIKVALILKGREMAHKELAYEKMDEFAEILADYGTIDQSPKMQGSQITMIITANNTKK